MNVRRWLAAGIVVVVSGVVVQLTATQSAGQAPPPAAQRPAQPAPSTPPAAQMPPAPPPVVAWVDSFATQRDSLMNVVLKQIAGRENAPAESVFKDIQSMKGMPAGRMLRIMNMGWGKSLGVGCFHCHVQGKWDASDKPQKQIARDMSALTATLNGELLPRIKNLKSDKPVVNCTTCHRGSVKPALNL